MPWESQLMEACDVQASVPTIRKAMRLYADYGKYVACEKHWLSKQDKKARLEDARRRLEEWSLEDFKRVRFSDEVHFG